MFLVGQILGEKWATDPFGQSDPRLARHRKWAGGSGREHSCEAKLRPPRNHVRVLAVGPQAAPWYFCVSAHGNVPTGFQTGSGQNGVFTEGPQIPTF